MKRGVWALALVLLAGCGGEDERACARVEALYAKDRAGGRAPLVGWSGESREGCLAKVRELRQGPRECLVRCYAQASEVGGLFDCERECAIGP